MKKHGHLFELICDPENIRQAMYKAARNKKWRRGIKKTFAREDEAVQEIHDMLVSGKYRTSRYHEKTLYEPKKRVIYSLPFFPDRIVHHAIMNVLEPIWNSLLDPESHSCRKGRGCHSGSRSCMKYVRQYKYALQSDISKFYPNVDHDVCKKIIRKKIKDKKLLKLLDEIIDSSNTIYRSTKGKNAPIGNLLSQWLGNLYLNELDVWLRNECNVKGYVRYCDDFIIFSNDKEFLNDIKRRLPVFLEERLKLKLSKSSLYHTSRGVDFLGYRHFPQYILVRKRVSKKIKRFVRSFFAGKIVDFKHAQGVAASYYGIMCHANTYHFRKSLNYNEILKKVGIKVEKI